MKRISEKTAVIILCSLIGICVIGMLTASAVHAYKKDKGYWQACEDCQTIWKSQGDTMYSGYYSPITEMPEEKYIDQLIEFEELVYMYKIKFPDIAIAQAYLESGYLTSPLFVETNNPFGMKVAKNRPTTNFGDYNGYAIYSSLKDAVVDYAIWQNGLSKEYTKDLESYMNYISSKYATDTNYCDKLWWIIRNQL